MSLVLHHASLQGLEALWVGSSPQEEQVVEGEKEEDALSQDLCPAPVSLLGCRGGWGLDIRSSVGHPSPFLPF